MPTSERENRFRRLFHRPRRIRTVWEGDTSGRPTMIVRSIIFFGIICLASGGWCCSQAVDPFLFEGISLKYRLPGRLLLFTGATLLPLGMLAITGGGRMVRVILITITQGLSLALLMEAIAAASAFAFYTTLTSGHLERGLLVELRQEYSKMPRVTFSWDKLQNEFKCCGVNGPNDWNNSEWKNREASNKTSQLPDSCCENSESSCDIADLFKRRKGCGELAAAALKLHLWSSCRCALACMFVHITLYLMVRFLEKKV